MRHAMRIPTSHPHATDPRHPEWCDTARCHAGMFRMGEHRSEPITGRTDSHSGHVIGTRVQTARGSHWLELSINVPLPGPTEQTRARYAHKVMSALAMTLGRIFYTRGAAR